VIEKIRVLKIYRIELVSGDDTLNGYEIEIKAGIESDNITVDFLSDTIDFIEAAKNIMGEKDIIYINFQPPCDLIIQPLNSTPRRCFPLNTQEIQEITTLIEKL